MKSLMHQINRELSLATPEEIKTALWKLEVKVYKRIIIRGNGEKIQAYIYILTFNRHIIPKEMKVGYCLKKVE